MLGTLTKTKMIRQAKFHCPTCAVKRHCKCYRKSKHFTILGLPIISYGKKEEWLECMGCSKSFGANELKRAVPQATTNPRVKEYVPQYAPPPKTSAYDAALRHTLVTMALADGEGSPVRIAKTVELLRQAGLRNITRNEVLLYAQRCQFEPVPLADYLLPLADQLSPQGKEAFLVSVLEIAAASRAKPKEDEILLAKEIAALLQIPVTQMDRIIWHTLDKRWV